MSLGPTTLADLRLLFEVFAVEFSQSVYETR